MNWPENMDNILKSILGVIGVSGACALLVSFINPEALNTSNKPIKVQGAKEGTEGGKLIEIKSEGTVITNGESQAPKAVAGGGSQDTAAQAAPVAIGNTKIIDYSNFGDAMVNPEPMLQVQHSYDPNSNNNNNNNNNNGNRSSNEQGTSPKDGTGFDNKNT
jgi:hypothetical protein